MAAAKGSLRRQQESVESYKDLSISTTEDGEATKIPKELLLDLSFLSDQERRTLIKVIKADQEFRKSTLDTVKKSIEKGRQFQELQKSATQDKCEKCTCCGLVLKSICSRTTAIKCSSCQNMVCKKCRKGDAKSSTCVLCIKERLMSLQTVDYIPVLKKANGVDEDLTEGSKLETPFFYGSELLKESLAQDSATTVEKQVTIQEKSRTLDPPAVLGPLTAPDMKQRRSRSLQPIGSTDSQPSTDVNDPASGFKLIRQGQSEEGLDDLGSLYSEPDYDSESVNGKVKLGIWYRTDERTLFVRVAKAKNLSSINGGTPDPYVRMHLLPDKTKLTKRRSSIQRKTTKPKFDEILKYGKLDISDVSMKTLWVTVWHWDRYGKNKFLGEVRLPLSTLDVTNTTDIWYNLHEYMDDSDLDDVDLPGSKGRLQLALKYSFHESTKPASLQRSVSTTIVDVHIKLMKAEGLPAMDPSGSTNAFVRSYLLPNRLVAAKRKTAVVFNSLNPIWEEEISYSLVSLNELETSRVLELTLWDHDRRGINAFIGGLRIGPDPIVAGNPESWMDSTANESSHWEAMLSQPGEWVEQWHELRPSMHPQQLIKKRRKTSFSHVNVNISLTSLSSGSITMEDRDTDSISPLVTVADSAHSKTTEKKKKDAPPPSISISRGARGDYKISGEVLTGIEYKEGELQVRINRAIKLAAVGKTGTSNPYVKIYLLPDSSKKSKLKTSIKKKTTDPVFNESFQYKISREEVTSRAMWLTVWSAGRLGNQFLGEACIPLGSLDLSDPGEQWYQLHDFVETGVILPPHLSTSQDHTHSRTSPASPSHRIRSNAFSRSSASRQGSGKSSSSGSQDFESFVPAGAPNGHHSTKKSLPRQVSTDSDMAHDQQLHLKLVIPQGEKRGSADSIIPVITVESESDQES